MTDTNRDGVFMQDSMIERSTIAVGRDATAVTIIDHASAALDDQGQHEIAERLRELQQALSKEKDQLGDSSQDVHDQTDAAAEELEKPEPRKSVVIGLLRRVAEDSGAVASVVNAVHALIDAVQRLL